MAVDKIEGAEAILKTIQDVTKDDFFKAEAVIAGSPVYLGNITGHYGTVCVGSPDDVANQNACDKLMTRLVTTTTKQMN